jgi:Mg/Co/Ni transporter MgtE
MRYPDHTAGRAMTTDFVCVQPAMTVGQVIEANKPRFLAADLIYYMYVTASEDDDTLVGVITVRDLLVQSPDTHIGDFMFTDFLAVRPGEHEREVARKMAEYNLLALPVVDRNNTLLGVITIDDALDSLLPAGWKKHLPRIFS